MNAKRLFTALMATAAIVASLASCSGKTAEATDLTAIDYAESLGLGWNLGNSLDAHKDGVANETAWHDQPATQATFDAVKRAGFGCVRIPVTWMGHIGAAPDYTIDEAWMARVTEVARFAHKAGLKCIVNIHHDGVNADNGGIGIEYHWLVVEEAAASDSVNAAIKERLAAVWHQIATNFKDDGDWLMFETLNEIHDGHWGGGGNREDGGRQYAVLNEWNQICVDAIRSAGGCNTDRFIGVPGYVCNPDLTIEHLTLPDDSAKDRLLVAVHSYDPWEYAGSGKYSEWGHSGKDIAPDTSEKTYTDMLDRLYDKFVKTGVPVYFGEFGCVHRADEHAEAFRKYYLEYVVKAMREHHMTGFYWDNGYDLTGDDAFGLINHADGSWIANGEEIVKIMVNAYNNDDDTYTLRSIYDRAPAAK